MPHENTLITTIVSAIVLACVLGALFQRLRLPPIVGYLLAGFAIGPFSPGFIADQGLAEQLAEIGVILLLFGVGLHFSPRELLAVRGVAVPGAIAQIAVATAMGLGLGLTLGWSVKAGLLFGLSLSVASTVVLMRALQERRRLETPDGRLAVGWLIVEDLAMVLALVFVPFMAAHQGGGGQLAREIGGAVLKIAGFMGVMMIVGRRLIPAALHGAAASGNREIFRLTVLALALGIAYAASELAGVSFALGAFFAGMLLKDSPLSHQASQATLSLRDAFAVIFFVSVGMLFDPGVFVRMPLALAATVAIVIFGKALVATAIVLAFRQPLASALTVSAGLAQVGEFSFILATLGVHLGLLPQAARDLVVGGALVTIMLNPLAFTLAERLQRRPKVEIAPALPLEDHAIVVGQGRVGRHLTSELLGRGLTTVAVDVHYGALALARTKGAHGLQGNAARPEVLAQAGVKQARWLFLALSDGFVAAEIADAARMANPRLRIVARAHAKDGHDELEAHGVKRVVVGELAIARVMLETALVEEGTPH